MLFFHPLQIEVCFQLCVCLLGSHILSRLGLVCTKERQLNKTQEHLLDTIYLMTRTTKEKGEKGKKGGKGEEKGKGKT